ncbi:hypothetical protein BDZ90DRAFT_149979 [Jaminaea rosea]|uniref:Uncharacterized protein n=1 Tax=Jaminaea rosea TaxID=1569628 RepID=A0A316UT77_9BASI|nr:hypothetical protein BDZ90DRAFT_149979 [Jaminaea rosea]PWN28499.1 hypothetical protein BDZ90DRAFT_149979 [Jaminaea rosea]
MVALIFCQYRKSHQQQTTERIMDPTSPIEALRDCLFSRCLVQPPLQSLNDEILPPPRMPTTEAALRRDVEETRDRCRQAIAEELVPSAGVFSQEDAMGLDQQEEPLPPTAVLKPWLPTFAGRNPTVWRHAADEQTAGLLQGRSFSAPGASSSAAASSSTPSASSSFLSARASSSRARYGTARGRPARVELLMLIGNHDGEEFVFGQTRANAPYAAGQGITITRRRTALITLLEKMRLRCGADLPPVMGNPWTGFWRGSVECRDLREAIRERVT